MDRCDLCCSAYMSFPKRIWKGSNKTDGRLVAAANIFCALK